MAAITLPPQNPHLVLDIEPPGQSPETIPQESRVETLPEISKEEGFSSISYLARAHVIGTIGAMCFRIYFFGSITLIAVASWYLYSAFIVVVNQAAEGSRLEKPSNYLHSIAMEVNSAMTATFLFPSTLFRSYHDSKGDLKGQPMLCINGYLSFGSTWHYLTERLVKAGFGPIRTMNVLSGTSIVTNALAIREEVKQFQKATGRNDLILVCHSKGGLAAAYYATHFAEEDGIIVTDIVLIGSPLAGTSAAYLGPGYDAAEMRTDSEFTQELRKKIEEYSQKIRFFYIASETDAIVSISSALSCALDPSRTMVLKDIGHLGLVFSSRVANQIWIWLYLRILKNRQSESS